MRTIKDQFMKRLFKIERMKQFFTTLFILAALTTSAQQYNNEWIQFNQTYYKFKVGSTGLYRIPKSVLTGAGIGETPVQNLELWNNGKMVPFYSSVPTGILPTGGYLEFWAERNDGTTDKSLYRLPQYQHTDKTSLLTDTAAYFLSVNTSGVTSKHTEYPNDPDASALPVEPYFMYTSGAYFRSQLNPGFAAVVGEYVFSSSFDKGEYWSSGNIYTYAPLPHGMGGLEVYTGGPANSSFKFGASGNALNSRSVRVTLNSSVIKDTVMDYFNDINANISIPTSLIAGSTANVQFDDICLVGTDRMVVSYYELNYPRTFNFSNATNFKFDLPAKPAGYKLEITNFNTGGETPVLYNITLGRRFVGNTSVPGKVRFAIPGNSVASKYVLVSESAANITTVSSLTPKTFIDYTLPANQGTYLIISHSSLTTGSTGNNPIAEYAAYRQSAPGGGYSSKVVDIDELVDQFAFGVKKHPISIKNFLRYARAVFTAKPKFAFLIGHGMTYNEYRYNESFAVSEQLNIIPTWGNPGSDNMLSSNGLLSPVPETPIGRLSVVNGKEIEPYLAKVKEYESVQLNSPNTIAGRAWMKNVVHVTGGGDAFLGTVLCNFMDVYKRIIADTLFGGKVYTFCKTTTNPVDNQSSEKLGELFKEGVSMLNYFGHSSATTLEFNLDNPAAYENKGKYPIFYVNGCNAGNFFTYYPQRLVVNETLSEKFVLAKDRGTIAFVASTHFGIVNYLNLFLNGLYQIMAEQPSGTLAETQKSAISNLISVAGPSDFYARLHGEEITFHGDPAASLNRAQQADYVIEASSINIKSDFISAADNTFDVKVKMMNLGKAVSDSVTLEIKREYPDGTSEIIYRTKHKAVPYMDSVTITVPIQSLRDKGQNKLVVTIDPDNLVSEVSESNNTASKQFVIFEDELRPVYPYNLSIVHNRTQHLFASTANPFAGESQFVMEIDTSAKFNSALKVTKTVKSIGGLVEFDPGISYSDSVVYHWRVGRMAAGGVNLWGAFSFIFIPGGVDGYNQSDYNQHAQSATERITLDSVQNKWKFGTRENSIFMRNGVFPSAATDATHFEVSVNHRSEISSVCGISGIVFNVFNPVSLKPWFNAPTGAAGRYGSEPICGDERRYSFQFNYMSLAGRQKAISFMDSIPEGYFVTVKNVSGNYYSSNTYVDTWMSDTASLGKDNSLYHRLIAQGFTDIDRFTSPRAWLFVYKKNGQIDFSPKSVFSEGMNDLITLSTECKSPDTLGYITSPKFGPAKSWKDVIWQGYENEVGSDNPNVQVIGVDKNGLETVLFNLGKDDHTFDVRSVSASQFPFMKLKMRNVDSLSLTPYQLKHWRIFYEPVPEGGLAPNLHLISKDTMETGEPIKFGIAFKNFTKTAFDSLAVKVTVLDKDNVLHVVPFSKLRPLPGEDSVKFYFELDSKLYPGNNTLFVSFNPDLLQPEQQLFNNFLYKTFYVGSDTKNPVLDVTFDGVHILNRDIVSAKPHIRIKLKDESKFNLLNDTALNTVQVRYPDGVLRTFSFGNDTLRFTPATSATDNSATIDFNPSFLTQINPEGDDYELIVSGKDKSGNKAGKTEFRVAFKVISKPMISNLLNYPNPFSTSTAFVFTLTGSEVPQNMKIQILTVTGKIVREITMNELGPVRIGRNITEFKWNGTDQYGQKLANGVYLYRVVTSLNGKTMDKYKAEGDVTDKFFNNGYGKMYLMR